MKFAIRSTIIITFFAFFGQIIGFVSQIFVAKIFGAGKALDAFIAASTLPQFTTVILLGSLGSVFIPVYIDYKVKGLEAEADRLVNILTNSILVILGIIALAGIVFSRELLQLSAPGLDEESLNMGSTIARIVWPASVASGLNCFFIALYQAENKFSWQAVVPFIGSLVNLIVIVLLANLLQGLGLAIAGTVSAFIQLLLLLQILKGKYRFLLDWNDSGIKRIFWLFLPLFLISIITKFTPLLDRYLGSEFGEGGISHLNYAFKIVGVASMIISAGISVIIFPKMSSDVSAQDFMKLKHTMAKGLKIMWLAIAPAISIGLTLSLPLIITVFQRNRFTYHDSLEVSNMLNVYLFALIGMCLGCVSGKIFYVLNDTKTLAIAGTIEGLIYAVYTVYLTKWIGILGIALGYVIYFNLSLIWHMIYIKLKLRIKGGKGITIFFAKVLLAALIAGIVTYLVTVYSPSELMKLIAGGVFGLITYAAVLRLSVYRELLLVFK